MLKIFNFANEKKIGNFYFYDFTDESLRFSLFSLSLAQQILKVFGKLNGGNCFLAFFSNDKRVLFDIFQFFGLETLGKKRKSLQI